MKASQRGFLSPRTIWILVLLLTVLITPLFWLDTASDPPAKALAKKRAAASVANTAPASGSAPAANSKQTGTQASTVAAAEVHNPDAFGMTWGLVPHDKLPAHVAWMSCHGQPREGLAQPHRESCNPYNGDTSCRQALPILCIAQDGSSKDESLVNAALHMSPGGAVTDGWAQGSIASTAPVAGFVIGSIALANARCEKELGAGWRMAEFHDAEASTAGQQAGWGFVAKRSTRLETRLRHWVHINDQPGNCWNNR
jgi:hypothetical protein